MELSLHGISKITIACFIEILANGEKITLDEK